MVVFWLSLESPMYGLVVRKEYHTGFNFQSGNMSGTMYPRYEITLINAYDLAAIDLSKEQYEKIKVFHIYIAPESLFVYQ